jgi:osmoprotectant transport system permease protein
MNVIEWFTDPANWTGPNGVPARALEQIVISFWAVLIALAVAMPVGLVLGHLRRGVFLATNVGNIGRAVPTLGVLVIFASIPAIGVGNLAAVLALAVFAIPPVLTNTFTGISSVDDGVRDAARGMGMGGGQLLARIEIPLAVPLVATGIRTATVQVVATASLAALVGGGGLGRYVVDGFALQDTTLIVVGAILTAALAMSTEGLLSLVQRAATPKGLRDQAAANRSASVEQLLPVEG